MKSRNQQKENVKKESSPVKFYKMKNEKTGVTANVHPDERLNYFRAGYMPIADENI